MSRPFREMPPWRQALTCALLGVSVAVVLLAERDIGRRAAEDIRGSRRLWRLLSLNALGALAYLRWGRLPDRS